MFLLRLEMEIGLKPVQPDGKMRNVATQFAKAEHCASSPHYNVDPIPHFNLRLRLQSGNTAPSCGEKDFLAFLLGHIKTWKGFN